jgi:putative heme-binding domain-containing protein
MQRRYRRGLVSTLGALIFSIPSVEAVAQAPAPRVVAARAAGPFEARVAFDRPVDSALAKSVVGRAIAFDETRPSVHSRPAQRAAAQDARGTLRIAAARLDDAGRTLVLTTDPHPRAATYTLELPVGVTGPSVAIAYDLTGVEAVWDVGSENAPPSWSGSWPALDTAEVREAAAGSTEHERGLALLAKDGRLTLNTLVTLPQGPVTLTVDSSAPVEATLGGEEPGASVTIEGRQNLPRFQTESTAEPTLLTLVVTTRKALGPLKLRVWTQRGESGPRLPLARDRLLLPWTPASPPAAPPLENVPDLAGGDPGKGAAVFASNEAKCASCHKVRGQGGDVGPDLSTLVGRDRTEVYRDIYAPSARINPAYLSYTVALKDGRVLVGTVRAEGADGLRVTDTEAKVSVVPRAQVEEFRPSATSIMPVGLVGAIGEQKLRDLIAFLTSPPPM